MPKKSATELRLSRPPGSGFEYDPGEDLAPDVFRVVWQGETVTVDHFVNRLVMTVHCTVTGAITDADRAKVSDVITAEMACLARLRMPCGVDE